ncbi:MAG: hypothetical protein Q8K86_05940 [Candidatus Nanopelagicaceae bacterium]|nr:hypothetical protein [Candidatus Nanopelagicaceae bacterium]
MRTLPICPWCGQKQKSKDSFAHSGITASKYDELCLCAVKHLFKHGMGRYVWQVWAEIRKDIRKKYGECTYKQFVEKAGVDD